MRDFIPNFSINIGMFNQSLFVEIEFNDNDEMYFGRPGIIAQR